MGEPPGQVEKVMSLDLNDFHRGLKVLDPALELENDQREVVLNDNGTAISIVFETLESAKLGGLLRLPRARVTIDLQALDTASANRFLSRFDKAFQRGGG